MTVPWGLLSAEIARLEDLPSMIFLDRLDLKFMHLLINATLHWLSPHFGSYTGSWFLHPNHLRCFSKLLDPWYLVIFAYTHPRKSLFDDATGKLLGVGEMRSSCHSHDLSHLRQLEGMDDESCRVIAGPFAIGVQLFLVRGQGGGESKAWFHGEICGIFVYCWFSWGLCEVMWLFKYSSEPPQAPQFLTCFNFTHRDLGEMAPYIHTLLGAAVEVIIVLGIT